MNTSSETRCDLQEVVVVNAEPSSTAYSDSGCAICCSTTAPEGQENVQQMTDDERRVSSIVCSSYDSAEGYEDGDVLKDSCKTASVTPDDESRMPSSSCSSSCCSSSSSSMMQKECRICLSTEESPSLVFVEPCMCKGSLRWAHVSCLQSWVHERRQLMCELCKSAYKEEYLPRLEHALYAASHHAVSGLDGQQQQTQGIEARRKKVLRTVVITAIVVITVTSLLVVLGLNASDHIWAAICLRVIAFGLPLLIILRCILLWYQARTVYS